MSEASTGGPVYLFVYGTLRPGEVRWHHLAPFVADAGVDATVPGELYDTGRGYPAAVFRAGGGACGVIGSGFVRGRVYGLAPQRMDEGLDHLDEVEGAVGGLYHRVVVHTSVGPAAWAYECGDEGLLARRIESGDWLDR